MPRRHTALALVVAVCWAVNFVVVDIGLESFPPLLFAALRFGLTAFPLAAVALGERPNLRQVVGVALAIAGIGAIAAGRAHDVPLPAVAVAGIAGLAYVVIVSTFFGYGHPSRNDSTGGSRPTSCEDAARTMHERRSSYREWLGPTRICGAVRRRLVSLDRH